MSFITFHPVYIEIFFRNLGENISHVELNTSKISTEQISSIENECNQCIRQSTPVVVHYLTKEEALGLEEVCKWHTIL